ncbi:uncharacterized protein K452DRAFT_330132 [Aplosporella prunicola CBS 121167]|uniref:AAA+ ATPase domain-containing protein n=1 Tax=Aplosporella prunicola CBS 121167 TaxID=1176127 RepID=A0A6A6AVA4_9PEZI|nr:uncharacterized protein K452DRAFT_330238 [Aplosporella prunicola CBS 121167]XP_033391328.1 uncharacterized protein K452DRAFT_330132 [Aplosporella prunicola CBS 121167]KAF2135366.1 hypothetical protein K452DRAFT_330238 [Aplosporella prunicola CBS 121167]KAF2135610.1 hypothetical protein K452DRAFT_330132 [Aplosporella prunicola CBS 121167]
MISDIISNSASGESKIVYKQDDGTNDDVEKADRNKTPTSETSKTDLKSPLQIPSDHSSKPKPQVQAEVPQETSNENVATDLDDADLSESPGNHENDNETNTEPGMLCQSYNLYEGKSEYSQCINWVDQIPFDMRVAEAEDKKDGAAVISEGIKRKTKIHSIVVQSPFIKKALQEVLRGYPGLDLDEEKLNFRSPFEPFVHRWKQWQSAIQKEGTNFEVKEHLSLLNEILRNELKEALESIRHFEIHGKITFEHLWCIYRPGSLLSDHGEEDRRCLYRLLTVKHVKPFLGDEFYRVTVNSIDWDGKRFGNVSASVQLPDFKGSRGIADFEVFPLDYCSDRQSITHKVVRRSMKLLSLCGTHYRAYAAVAKDVENKPLNVRWVRGRIVIDAAGFAYINPQNVHQHSPLSIERDPADSDNESNEPEGDGYIISQSEPRLDENQLLICTCWIRGFSIEAKKWVQLLVFHVQDIAWNGNVFDKLVLPLGQKRLLLSLARTQREAGDTFDDVIRGKGQGTIVLLNGSPGVGKTLTAEAVAEEMKAPLYSISAGELGTQPDVVEQRLKAVFETVRNWRAVLLLDEADIFLEQRNAHDLQRNSLVSIFLQRLEYFSGTLFLTTNRVETFDAAFSSRIHLSLTYPDLDVASRRKVWSNFFSNLERAGHNISETQLDTLASINMNGREIKNAMKLGSFLARDEDGPLSMEHLRTVLIAMQKWKLEERSKRSILRSIFF